MEFRRISHFKDEVRVPGDESISHRAVVSGSVTQGFAGIHNFLQGADYLSIIACFEKMGTDIENKGGKVLVHDHGLHGPNMPREVLDCRNSGTTTRLMSGISCDQNFDATLTGGESTRKRPTKRIMEPFTMMGTRIISIKNNDCVPLFIKGGPVHGIHYDFRVASARVRSIIMLVGLYADSPANVTESYASRNRSELMLQLFGTQVSTEGAMVVMKSANELHDNQVMVPEDISSAAYFIAGGLMVPGSQVLMRNVGINPARDGILRVRRDMGAYIELLNVSGGIDEPTADILIRRGNLHGTVIGGSVIPTLINEFLVTAATVCLVEDETVIRDAGELRVKESNRIAVMVQGLTAMGTDVTETEDGMIIQGGAPLHRAVIDSHKDHRIAMTFTITALCADSITEIRDADCVSTLCPGFCSDLEKLA